MTQETESPDIPGGRNSAYPPDALQHRPPPGSASIAPKGDLYSVATFPSHPEINIRLCR
jgi:hypothetical protein